MRSALPEKDGDYSWYLFNSAFEIVWIVNRILDAYCGRYGHTATALDHRPWTQPAPCRRCDCPFTFQGDHHEKQRHRDCWQRRSYGSDTRLTRGAVDKGRRTPGFWAGSDGARLLLRHEHIPLPRPGRV